MHLRQYEIVQDEDKLKVDIQQTCMKYKTIKQWAYILHDKDDTRPHYHIYLYFGTGVDSSLVAEWFKLGYTDESGNWHTGENFINKVKGRRTDMLLYLTHENESQKYKHIYSRDEVHSNFDFSSEIEQSKVIGDFEHYSYAQQIEYIDTLPIDEKTKAYNKLSALWKLYCQVSVLQADRHVEVIFVTGAGGTGKTYYAKKLCREMNKDFCVSSSSNDPFQDYMGQKAFIFDDLRDTAFENLEDLLKILDNNTQSSAKSRFNNKVFNGDLMIITSSVPLRYWYRNYKGMYGGADSLTQLYRRICLYVQITHETITLYREIDNNGCPKGMGRCYVNELSKESSENVGKTDFESVFDKMCESEPTPFDSKKS